MIPSWTPMRGIYSYEHSMRGIYIYYEGRTQNRFIHKTRQETILNHIIGQLQVVFQIFRDQSHGLGIHRLLFRRVEIKTLT